MRLAFGRWLGILTLLALIVSMGATGCAGGKKCTITGTVSYKGTPLKGGNITFVSTAGKLTVSGVIAEDGSYKLQNVPAGTVKICVETRSLLPPIGAMTDAGPMAGKMGAGKNPPTYAPPPGMNSDYKPPQIEDKSKRYVRIPDLYANEKTTKLDYTVESSTKKDIDLTD
jgi:hypothetical protein